MMSKLHNFLNTQIRKQFKFGKKILSIGFMFIFMLLVTGCENINPDDFPEPIPEGFTEVDVDYPEINVEDPLFNGECLFTYGSMVAGENISADGSEWKGYHKLGNELGKVPTRMFFSPGGNIKMYTKPMDIHDWELMKDFNVDRMKVPTEDENIDDIIEFPKATNHCLFEDTKENSSKDFPCITLYPEGAPISAGSPFNVGVCINTPGSITVNMLKHTFYLTN